MDIRHDLLLGLREQERHQQMPYHSLAPGKLSPNQSKFVGAGGSTLARLPSQAGHIEELSPSVVNATTALRQWQAPCVRQILCEADIPPSLLSSR